MTNAAELELKNKKLELEENEQIIGMLKTSSSDNFKREKSEADRSSKEKLKEMEIMGKAAIEEFKMDKEDEREVMKVLKDKFETEMKNETELDIKGLDALVRMAISQQKEMKNDAEG